MRKTTNRFSFVRGKKVLCQHPNKRNCMVVAILNAYLQDNDVSDKEILKLEEKYDIKYDIQNRGLQVTIAGAIAWDLGYYSGMYLSSALGFKYAVDDNNNGVKIIRTYGWDMSDSFQWPEKITNERKKYREKFENINKQNNITGCHATSGCHSTLVTKMNKDTGNCFFINLMDGVNTEYNWWKLGRKSFIENPHDYRGGDETIFHMKKLNS